MGENENTLLRDLTNPAPQEKKQKPNKIHYCIFYLVFCAAVFMFWQLLGGVCVEYNKLGYSLGHSESYLWWSWFLLITWVIGSIVFAIIASGSKLRDQI